MEVGTVILTRVARGYGLLIVTALAAFFDASYVSVELARLVIENVVDATFVDSFALVMLHAPEVPVTHDPVLPSLHCPVTVTPDAAPALLPAEIVAVARHALLPLVDEDPVSAVTQTLVSGGGC